MISHEQGHRTPSKANKRVPSNIVGIENIRNGSVEKQFVRLPLVVTAAACYCWQKLFAVLAAARWAWVVLAVAGWCRLLLLAGAG